MTTISSASQQVQHRSPLAQLQKTLSASITAGTINAADKDALTSALDTIDSAMQASKASGSRPSPEGGKAKVESMIDDMVSSGSLTSEQASELKSVFEDTFAGGPGGAKGKMGPPPPPPPEDSEDTESTSDTVSLTLTGSSTDISSLLKQLLENLASNGQSTYSSTATANSNVSSLFLDKSA